MDMYYFYFYMALLLLSRPEDNAYITLTLSLNKIKKSVVSFGSILDALKRHRIVIPQLGKS